MLTPTLTPTLLQPLLAGLSRTLARDAQDPEAAAALLESFHPETPIQAMLAAQAIALHHAAIDCFGRAMRAGEQDDPTATTRLQRNAASLTRAFTATLRTLQRCQAEAAREDPVQREPLASPSHPQPLQPASSSTAAWQTAQHDPMQQPAPGLRPGGEAAPGLQPADQPAAGFRPAPQQDIGEDPVQREQPARRPWEELTEAEQFAILYPERIALGATSHEDADLWLHRFTNPARPPRAAR